MENADQNYSEFLELMRNQGRMDNPQTLFIGTVKTWASDNSKIKIEVDDLILDQEDILVADYLMDGFKFPLKTPYVSSVTFGHYDGSFKTTNPAVKKGGLKKGDLVAVMKCNDNDTYVILAKVVSP